MQQPEAATPSALKFHFVVAFVFLLTVHRALAFDETLRLPPGALFRIPVSGQFSTYNFDASATGTVQLRPPTNRSGLTAPTYVVGKVGMGTGSITINIQPLGFPPSQYNYSVIGDASEAAPAGTAANHPQTRKVGDPVNVFTGELVASDAPDLYLGGPMPLMFARYYASRMRRDWLVHSALGVNWSHNFDFSLVRFSNDVQVVTWRGRIVRFQKSGSNWVLTGDLSIPFQLVENGTNYFFGDPRLNRVYTFDTDGNLTAIADGRGNVHTLTYDSNGQLATVSDGLGRTLGCTYSPVVFGLSSVTDGTRAVDLEGAGPAGGNGLGSVVNANGQKTIYSYAEDGDGFFVLLRNVTTPGFSRPDPEQVFNTNGQVVAQTHYDAVDNQTYSNTFAYLPTLTATTNALNGSKQFSHDSAGRLLSSTDEAGKTESFGYDANGRLVAVTNQLGEVTTVSYHAPSGKPASITRPDGRTTTYQYSGRVFNGVTLYDVSSITFPDGTQETFTRDSNGNVIAFTDRSGRTTSWSYNGHGQPLTRTNASGGVTLYTYNADGTLASIRDPALNMVTFAYDSLRRLAAATNADGTFETWQYNATDRVTKHRDASGGLRQYTYGPHNFLTAATDAETNEWDSIYFSTGQFEAMEDPSGSAVVYLYDELGRLREFRDNRKAAAAVDFKYDARGRVSAATDFDGNTNSMTYDDAGRLASITDPLANTRSFNRDVAGRVTDFMSSLTNITHLDYDSAGRPAALHDAEGQSVFLGYDPAGRLIHANAGYATADFNHDALGLLTVIQDGNGQSWNSPRDASGRITSRSDPLGRATAISYDDQNRPALLTFPAGLGTLTLTYDGAGRVTRRQYSDGTDLQYDYDKNGNLKSANGIALAYDERNLMTNANGIAVTRDEAGRVQTMTLAPGKTITYAYNNRDLVTSVQDWLGGTITFGYDAAGRMTNITRPNGVNGVYTYDAENELQTIQEGSIVAMTFTRDHNGRITQVDRTAPVPAAPPGPADFTFDAASQVNGFLYDALGRLLHDAARGYQWDLAARMLSYTNGVNTVSFTYDALGNRLTRTNGVANRQYVWNYALDLPSVSIERQNGADLRYYVHAPDGSLLYSVDATADARQFYHYDETGNTLALTDDSGTVVGGYAWGPYGETAGASGSADNAFTWQGRWGVMEEAGTGLYYHRARFYDSASARFLSRDPLQSIDPRRINPYQYAAGNPQRFVDPTGARDRMAAWMLWRVTDPMGYLFRQSLYAWEPYFRAVLIQQLAIQNIHSRITSGRQIGADQPVESILDEIETGPTVGSLSSAPPEPQKLQAAAELTQAGPTPPGAAGIAKTVEHSNSSAGTLNEFSSFLYLISGGLVINAPLDGGMSSVDPPSLKLSTELVEPVESILEDIVTPFKDPANPTPEEMRRRLHEEPLIID